MSNKSTDPQASRWELAGAGADVLTKSLGSNPRPQHGRVWGFLSGLFPPPPKKKAVIWVEPQKYLPMPAGIAKWVSRGCG